jgi:hypothetical protein
MKKLMFKNIFKKRSTSFIVYQMGKVGSSTIKTSLVNKYGENSVLHTHSHKVAKVQIEQQSRLFESVVVITGFREPLARCISAYFQNITNISSHWYVGAKEEVMSKNIGWLINDYNEKVKPHILNTIAPWLSNYENAINLKLADFNSTGSYWKVTKTNVIFYIYKLETINEFYQQVKVEKYFKNIDFTASNIGAKKWSGVVYRDFIKSFRISRNDYKSIYGDIDYLKYLYNDNEIRKITNNLVAY